MPLASDADLNQVSPELARLLPDEIVYEAGLLPLRRRGERSLVVGWVDPTEPGRVEEAEFFAGYTVTPHVMTAFQMASAFERVWQRDWKIKSVELQVAQRQHAVADFSDDRLFEWLDLLVTLELEVEQFRLVLPPSAPVFAADARVNETAHDRAAELQSSGPALRQSTMESTGEGVPAYAAVPDIRVNADAPASVPGPGRFIATESDLGDAPLRLAEPASSPVVDLGPELIRSPGMPRDTQAPAMRMPSSSAEGASSLAPTPVAAAVGAPRRMVLDMDPPIPSPPVKASEQAADDESIKASLITGMFRAPTAEQIELEQARRRLQHLPHYRRSERSGSLQSVSADTDSHRSSDEDYPPSSIASAENSPGRPRQLTPASTFTTGSYAAAIPLPVSSGTFHQLPARIFDATGPAQGPVRAAFRAAVKGLNACGSREAIAREIVESLGIVFANVLLLQPRLPHLQVWDASLRKGTARLVGAEFEMVDEGFWQRVRTEQLTFRGALLPDDPFRLLIGRELGSDTLVLPLTMNRRTVAILVIDNGRDQALAACGGLFKPFDEAITGALRRMIMTNKRPQWQPN
jgi:hypothetical protein